MQHTILTSHEGGIIETQEIPRRGMIGAAATASDEAEKKQRDLNREQMPNNMSEGLELLNGNELDVILDDVSELRVRHPNSDSAHEDDQSMEAMLSNMDELDRTHFPYTGEEPQTVSESQVELKAEWQTEGAATVPSRRHHICDTCGNDDLVRAMKCANCRRAYYCDKECQHMDWNRHKKDCKKQPSVRTMQMPKNADEAFQQLLSMSRDDPSVIGNRACYTHHKRIKRVRKIANMLGSFAEMSHVEQRLDNDGGLKSPVQDLRNLDLAWHNVHGWMS